MLDFAPRLTPRLLTALERLDDPALPIAEVNRRVGREATRMGLFKPSYECVRRLVRQLRGVRRGPSTLGVLLDIAFRARPPEALLDHLSGIGVPPLPRRGGPL